MTERQVMQKQVRLFFDKKKKERRKKFQRFKEKSEQSEMMARKRTIWRKKQDCKGQIKDAARKLSERRQIKMDKERL